MGTRGYRVYRHRGYYHVHYNHYDSYPDGLGIQVAAEVPCDDEAYKKWLENLRVALDRDFALNVARVDAEDGGYDYFITKNQPTNDIFIEWIYEIDLDHEVFLVDSNPLFALNNMPPSPDLFLKWIGVDSYGHRSYHRSTPEQHIYNWKSPPPKVDDSIIDDYVARHPTPESGLSISELLGTTGGVSGCEAARIALYEVIIGEILKGWRIGHSIRILETAADRADISDNLLSVGLNIVRLTGGPMIFGSKAKEASSPERLEFSWLAPDICLRITTHLDDERNMKRGILELADELIVNRRPRSVAYGVLFSFFHCVIVRVDPQNRIKSTAALQFLPSFFATSPSTPGITAIGSLAYYCLDTPMNTIHPDHFLHKVPFDVLELIAVKYLRPSDVESLCAAAPPFQQAAASVLRFPHIEDYRLVEVLEDDTEKKNEKVFASKAFSTMAQGSSGPVIVVGKGTDAFGFLLQVGDSVKKVKWQVDQSGSEQDRGNEGNVV
ncbi:hypothetical protein B0H19DRAFT_975817 [Mycena capillaripes]|nr:hypothetical protein B0H19DRAFT_975817 [Mycena capillaripes]